MAKDLRIDKALFESNYRVLIDCLNNKVEHCPWEIAAMVEDIKTWVSRTSWAFGWIPREQNNVAHLLAFSCLDRAYSVIPGCIPPGLDSLILKDRTG